MLRVLGRITGDVHGACTPLGLVSSRPVRFVFDGAQVRCFPGSDAAKPVFFFNTSGSAEESKLDLGRFSGASEFRSRAPKISSLFLLKTLLKCFKITVT